jgi:hypothetical protein
LTLGLPALLIALSVATRPGFSANDESPPGGEVLGYYRYTVEVEVEGKPVTLSRVVLCTGRYVTRGGVARDIAAFASPGVIGAFTGENQAVYANTPGGVCAWVAGISGAEPLAADYVPFVIRAPDAAELDDMEVFVSRMIVLSGEAGIKFVSAKAEKATEAEFKASEAAAKDGPDLSALVAPFQTCPRPRDARALKVPVVSHALLIPAEIWSGVPEVASWVADLPESPDRAFRAPAEVIDALFRRTPAYTLYINQREAIENGSGLPAPSPPDSLDRSFSMDAVHPAFVRGGFVSVERRRQGSFGAQRRTPSLARQTAGLTRNAYSEASAYDTSGDGIETSIAVAGRIVFISSTRELMEIHSETIIFGGQTDKIPIEGAIRHDYCN